MPKLSAERLDLYVPQARVELVAVAQRRELIPYGAIMNRYGGRGYFGQVLDELNRRESEAANPLISALVVLDQPDPIASRGFFQVARELRPGSSNLSDRGFWEAECNRVWSHPWT